MTRPHRLAAMLLLAAVATACGVSTDDSPRDIPAAQQRELGIDTERDVGAATGTARIYLLLPATTGTALQLTAVARDVDDSPAAVLGALLDGPNAVELDAQYRTALPTGTELRSATLRGGTLLVDLSDGVLQLSGDTLVGAIAQIVFTASELDGVRAVKIVVEGQDQQWPVSTGELQSTPLTVYDYPGLVPSAQPEYPAIPTPTQP